MCQIKFVEKINTHILFFNKLPPPPPENLAVYEIILKNMVQPDRPGIACWVIKATNTYSEYTTYFFS